MPKAPLSQKAKGTHPQGSLVQRELSAKLTEGSLRAERDSICAKGAHDTRKPFHKER